MTYTLSIEFEDNHWAKVVFPDDTTKEEAIRKSKVIEQAFVRIPGKWTFILTEWSHPAGKYVSLVK